MRALILLPLLAGCPSDPDPEAHSGDTGGGTTSSESSWAVVADRVPGGVMLSAYTAGDEVLIVGGDYGTNTGTLWRYTETRLCHETAITDHTLWWIHGRSATDYYMVGEAGTILHSVDGARTEESVDTTATLFGVYDDGTDVWAVGGDVGTLQGQIWRKEPGGTWALAADALPSLVFKTWNGWFVGDGVVLRWNGESFDDLTPASAPRLLTIRGRSEEDVFAVGGLQTPEFFQRDEGAWSQPTLEPACVAQGLNGVYTAPNEAVWVAGNYGNIASWDGTAWDCPSFPLTAEHFHAAWPGPNGSMLFVGGNLFAGADNYGTIARHGAPLSAEITVEACD